MDLARKPATLAPTCPPQTFLGQGARAAEAWPLRRSLEIVTLGWIFGAVWMTAVGGSPMTQYMKSLNGSPFQFGVLAALPFIASLVSVPASLLIERTGKRKAIFLAGLYLQRLLWFPLALIPLWMLSRHGQAAAGKAMLVFLGLTFLMHAAGAFGGPAWVSWMADVVPDRVRGNYFSRRRQWGILSAIPTALLVGWVLDRFGVGGDSLVALRWCAIIFMCAAVFGLVDIHMFYHLPDAPKPPVRDGGLLKAFAGPMRDRRFMVFGAFVATLVFAVGFMSQFVNLYLKDKVYVGDKAASFNVGTQLMVLVAPMAAQLLVLPVWGKAADRMGKKPVLILAGLGLVPVALGWCLVGPSRIWLGYLLSAASAVLWTGVEIANFNLVLEMSGSAGGERADRPSGGSAYVAVNTVIVNVAGCLGGLFAGLIAQYLKDWQWTALAGCRPVHFYDVLFVLSGVLRLGAVVVFLPFIHEPGARTAREALRFMIASLREGARGLVGTILQPLRLIALRRPEGYA